MDFKEAKEKFNNFGIVFKNPNTESIIFVKKIHDKDFLLNVSSIFIDLNNKEFINGFELCRQGKFSWLSFYDFLYKKFQSV